MTDPVPGADPAKRPAWSRSELAYCSNVHPGTDLAAVLARIAGPLRGVRERRGLERMSAGLWLSAQAAAELAGDRGRLLEALDANGVALQTLNGFPFGGFHDERVKERVYSPAWDRRERLDYTLDLAKLLSACLAPEAREGTISSLPLGFAPEWDAERQEQALANLCRLAVALARLADRDGRPVRVCLEPEPGCVLESTADALALFERDLPTAARAQRVSPEALRNHLGICLDICHQAVIFEDPGESLARLAEAGVAVGKVQISSALHVADPSATVLADLARDFAEPRYLHQVRARLNSGELAGYPDLPQALDDPGFPRDAPWRVHFHIPIHAGTLARPGLATTQDEILSLLDRLVPDPHLRPHLEVETYTWEILPPDLRPPDADGLAAGLTAELDWLERRLAERGGLREPPAPDSLARAPQ